MTIDEVIKRIKEKMACDYNISGCDTCNISSCEDKDTVIQLAEWLEELKFLRQWKSDIMYSFCKYDVNSFEELVANTRNKAIDDFAKEYKSCDNRSIQCKKFLNCADCIAEQLKAGVDNE